MSSVERRSSRRLVLATLLALAVAGGAAADTDWARRDLMDPRSGDSANAPSGRNADGFRLDFLRATSGEVLALFRLPAGDRDFLDATKPPLLALDAGPQRSVLLLEGGLTWAAFPVWNGQGNAGAGLLRELMQGTKLEVTYFLHGGGYKTTDFELDGAATLLASAFDVPETLSPEEIAAARALETAIEEAGAACLELKKKKRERCLETARACIERSATADALQDCLSSGG